MSDTMPPLDYDSLFEPQFNYSAADISRKTGLHVDLIKAAGERREISNVITMARDGVNKMWKGHKVIAWLKRRDPEYQVPRQQQPTSPQENATK